MECRITIVTFDKKVGSSLLSAFRGAIAPLFPEENIYHNHEGKSLMYRYPLIQYKLIEGRISIVGINEGAASVENHFHCGQSLTLRLYDKDMELRVSNKMTYYYIPESFEKSENYYFLRGWLPLNQENYIKYLNAESISEKISLLDNILSANILSLFSGFGYYSLSSIFITEYKGAELGTIALVSNIIREIFTLLAAPLLARWFGPLAPISAGGATTMDTTLPIIMRSSGNDWAVLSILHGCIADFSVPFVVTFFCTI